MSIEDIKPGPLLAIDIGGISTRCMLFDTTGERYRLHGIGTSMTTLSGRGSDLRFGLQLALEELQANTGRKLLDGQKNLIHPVNRDGYGVGQCVATLSAGDPLKLYLVNLSNEMSFASAEWCARSTYIGQIKSTCLNDDREPIAVVDEILTFRPDLIMITGGTEKTASPALLHILEPVEWALGQLPDAYQPELLFIGIESLQPLIEEVFGHSSRLHMVGYSRSGANQQAIMTARATLAQVTVIIRSRQIPGMADVIQCAAGNVFPTYWGFGRVIQYLSKASRAQKGVTGIDYGYGAATFVAAYSEQISFGIYPVHNWSESISLFPGLTDKQILKKWVTSDDPPLDAIQEFYFNHSLYPTSQPVSKAEREIVNQLNRYILGNIVDLQRKEASLKMRESEEANIFWGEPILASGHALTHAVSLSQACLALLDSLQPVGITTFILDPRQIAACLGALADINPTAAAELIESDLFLHLATVISPVGQAPAGTPILRVKMTSDDRSECTMDVHQGDLEVIPISPGKSALLQLQPFHRYDIGMGGAGRGGSVRITGSALGIVIDARGRPLILPEDLGQRGTSYRKWLWMLGG